MFLTKTYLPRIFPRIISRYGKLCFTHGPIHNTNFPKINPDCKNGAKWKLKGIKNHALRIEDYLKNTLGSNEKIGNISVEIQQILQLLENNEPNNTSMPKEENEIKSLTPKSESIENKIGDKFRSWVESDNIIPVVFGWFITVFIIVPFGILSCFLFWGAVFFWVFLLACLLETLSRWMRGERMTW